MNRSEVQKLIPGLYKIFWKQGGHSYASIGVKADGGKWLAPINWVAPTLEQDIWKKIEKVEIEI